MAGDGDIAVEVAFALPDRQRIIALRVPVGCTVFEAAEKSGITRFFPELMLEHARMGIFGKAVPDPRSHELHEGDRIEIYRPLTADPKEARKQRAKKAAAR